MKILKYIFLFLLLCGSSVFAQGFEGELIYKIRDSTGKISPFKMYGRGEHARMSFDLAGAAVDFYLTPDSMAIVVPNENIGFMLGKDSAIAFIESYGHHD